MFSVAMMRFYRTTGGSPEYGERMISYFQDLFSKYSPKQVFEKTKYTLDVSTFGLVLSGALRNPLLVRYKPFIMNMYKMTPGQALKTFQKTKKNR
jgi:hypothetical protein